MNECKWDRKRGRGVCGPTSIIATKAILLSVAVGGSSDRDGDASVHPSIHEKRLLLHLLLLHALWTLMHRSRVREREREKKGLERREISRMDQASGNNDKKQAAAAFVFVSFSVSQLAIASLSA